MLDAVNRHLIQPLVARKRRSEHLRYLRELERSQFDSPRTVRESQFIRLQARLHHTYATVLYYRHAWDGAMVHPW